MQAKVAHRSASREGGPLSFTERATVGRPATPPKREVGPPSLFGPPKSYGLVGLRPTKQSASPLIREVCRAEARKREGGPPVRAISTTLWVVNLFGNRRRPGVVTIA